MTIHPLFHSQPPRSQPPRSRPPRNQRHVADLSPTVAARATLLLSITLALSTSAMADEVLANEVPRVFAVSPDHGTPGSDVTIDGEGFSADADDQVAFVFDDATGTGAFLDVEAATPTRLDGRLGASPDAFSGRVHVWTGRSYSLPGLLFRGEQAVYLVERAEYFAATAEAEGPGLFTVTDSLLAPALRRDPRSRKARCPPGRRDPPRIPGRGRQYRGARVE